MYHFTRRTKEEQNTHTKMKCLRLSMPLLSYEDHVTSAERIQIEILFFLVLQRKEVESSHTKEARTLTETGTVKQDRYLYNKHDKKTLCGTIHLSLKCKLLYLIKFSELIHGVITNQCFSNK